MAAIYIFVLNTMADWEIGHLTAEAGTRRFFEKDAPTYEIKFVGSSSEMISTMGGLQVTPDLTTNELSLTIDDILVLPGADTWAEPGNKPIVEIAKTFLEAGGTLAAICGATVALANAGILNTRKHTSNGAGFLEMFSPAYKGSPNYIDSPAVSDGNLITGAASGALLWTKLILERMGVMKEERLEAWYQYFKTGEAKYFFSLMQ